jgi:hypothetical protein
MNPGFPFKGLGLLDEIPLYHQWCYMLGSRQVASLAAISSSLIRFGTNSNLSTYDGIGFGN